MHLVDLTAGRNAVLMRDVVRLREWLYAEGEGDPERAWEMTKLLAVSFAGSTHKKYLKYLLEMIVTLELESTPEMKSAILQLSVANLKGREGGWAGGDFIQEYFNCLLKAVIRHKGAEYGD